MPLLQTSLENSVNLISAAGGYTQWVYRCRPAYARKSSHKSSLCLNPYSQTFPSPSCPMHTPSTSPQDVDRAQCAARSTAASADARLHTLLAAQRGEYEAAMARHLALVDRLLADKDVLTKRLTEAAAAVKVGDENLFCILCVCVVCVWVSWVYLCASSLLVGVWA